MEAEQPLRQLSTLFEGDPRIRTVNGGPGLGYSQPPATLTVGVPIEAITAIPRNFMSTDTITYSITSGTRPAGLLFDSPSGRISGTPSEANANSVTITVTASAGTGDKMKSASAEITFPPVVKQVLATPVVTLQTGDARLTPSWEAVTNATGYELQYKAVTTTSWDATSGVTTVGSATSGRAITGLTNGRTYDVRVRAQASGSTVYEDNGDWSSAVQGTPIATDTAPDFGSKTVGDRIWAVGTSVNLALPAATGGNGDLSYELTPTLPAGVTLDVTTRTLSGAPTAATDATTYTWRVKDDDSNEEDSDTAALTFTLTVSRATLATPVVTLDEGDEQLTPSWAAVAGAASYELQWKAVATTSWDAEMGVTTVESATSGTAITGLTNGTEYEVRVRAEAAAGSDDPRGQRLVGGEEGYAVRVGCGARLRLRCRDFRPDLDGGRFRESRPAGGDWWQRDLELHPDSVHSADGGNLRCHHAHSEWQAGGCERCDHLDLACRGR